MKKFQKRIVKLSIISFAFAVMWGCNENASKIPLIKFERVSEFTRDSISTYLEYKGLYDRMSSIKYQVGNSIRSSSGIDYNNQGMTCTINDLTYDVQLDATIGGSRAFMVRARKGEALVYNIEYQYDKDDLLHLVKFSKPDTGTDTWIVFKYTDSSIEIRENDVTYTIPLSSEENTGYACNVYAFSEAPLTSMYVINPDLYFLNIYGMPVKKLPAGYEIRRVSDSDNRLAKVGKYSYKY